MGKGLGWVKYSLLPILRALDNKLDTTAQQSTENHGRFITHKENIVGLMERITNQLQPKYWLLLFAKNMQFIAELSQAVFTLQ